LLRLSVDRVSVLTEEPSITSEVVILEPTVDYARVEFPDLNVVEESLGMAVQYPPFLQLGELRPPEAIMEMSRSPRGDGEKAAASDGSKNASTTTTASDDDRAAASSSPAKAVEKPRPPTRTNPRRPCPAARRKL
jgi:hypothetical protein